MSKVQAQQQQNMVRTSIITCDKGRILLPLEKFGLSSALRTHWFRNGKKTVVFRLEPNSGILTTTQKGKWKPSKQQKALPKWLPSTFAFPNKPEEDDK